MTPATLQNVRDWVVRNKTVENYAFSPFIIAAGLGANPIQVAVLCQRAVDVDALASVEIRSNMANEAEQRSVLYTDIVADIEDRVSRRIISELIEKGKLRQMVHTGSARYEWVSLKTQNANLTESRMQG